MFQAGAMARLEPVLRMLGVSGIMGRKIMGAFY